MTPVSVMLDHPSDVEGWRAKARALVQAEYPPEAVVWHVAGGAGDLFVEPFRGSGGDAPVRGSRRLLGLVGQILLHSADDRFSLAYRLLWRFQTDRTLLDRAADPDIRRADILAKAVRRDIHKMRAFLRFKVLRDPDGTERFAAWFEPEHHIVEANAPFFRRRFAQMRWAIVTPRRSVFWDGARLTFGPGGRRADVPAEDAMEDAWRTYYASIFNPARLKTQAMRSEMPVKYWKNLPEARLIPELTRAAQARTAEMMAPREETLMEETFKSLTDLAGALEGCTRCPLYGPATQAVPGEGPLEPALMFVGEQPGDREDTEGRPFVGPAGEVFDRALGDVGIDRDACYVTNAVKHFKFTERGKRRIHQSPSTGEISKCRWWLDREIALVRPKIVVALGASAAQAVLRRRAVISKLRGIELVLPEGGRGFVTVHPSYLLRLPDAEAKAREWDAFRRDLEMVAKAAA